MNSRHCAVRAERNMPMTDAHVGPTIPFPEEPMQVSEYRYLLQVADPADWRGAKGSLTVFTHN